MKPDEFEEIDCEAQEIMREEVYDDVDEINYMPYMGCDEFERFDDFDYDFGIDG